MKEKLSRIRSPWRRLLVSLVINCLVAFSQLRYKSARARVHWIGSHGRPRRLERLLFVVLFIVPMLIMEPRNYILWSLIWGGGVSLFVISHSFIVLFSRKPSHWINSEFQ